MNDGPFPSPSDEASEEREQDIAEVGAIATGLDRWYDQLGRQFGPLSRPQRRMLLLLSVDTRVRVSDLSEQLGVTTAGTTRMLDKLEALGYAARSRMDQYDQRQVYVTLTPEGTEALREAEHVFMERMQTILNKLTPAERATLAHLLQSLSEPSRARFIAPRARAKQCASQPMYSRLFRYCTYWLSLPSTSWGIR